DELYNEVTLFHETVLPDLKGNVKCGNSLIGTDYFEGRLEFSTNEIKDIKPFDWEKNFDIIFENGGFDCVIGNPPYVRQEVISVFKKYFENHYKAYHSIADLYVYFIEKAHILLKHGGLFGYIVSNKWIRSNYGKSLRDLIRYSVKIIEIIDFGELPVFDNAATFPAIIITEKSTVKEQHFDYAPIKTLSFDSLSDEKKKSLYNIDSNSLNGENWTLVRQEEIVFLEKMNQNSISLGELINGNIYRGVLTGLNEAFVVDRETRDRLIAEDAKSAELIKPFALGDDIRKYKINFKERYLIFSKRGINIKDYPAIESHLQQYRERLTPKPLSWKGKEWKGRKPGSYQWFEIQDTIDYYKEFEKPKIVYPDIAKQSRFSYDNKGMFFTNTVYFIPLDDLFLLGVLNSKPVFSYFKRIAAVLGDADKGGRLRFFTQDVVKIPIPKNRDDNIVDLVKQSLVVYDKLNNAEHEQDKSALLQHAELLDKKIDELVYKLYSLTEEEIRIVEGA
ncbi:MAG TPA: TaqI-like C-terminal specificity domain-containing protein, partial [Spirochaetota bacterium]|nr:TaqI-like C-terminal specificity domain-containing protein [Spirochaetota bacterium]